MAEQTPVSLSAHIQGDGYPVLCLHGHPGSGQSMSVFTHHLAQRFRTIAPDLRGYGSSRVQVAFEMTDHLVDLEQLLDQLQIPQCLVLGWSLGGIMAMELALKHPNRVSGLILVATAARPRSSHPAISQTDNVYTGLAALINWLAPGWPWNIETFGKRSLFRYLIQQHTPATYHYLAKEAVSAYLQTSPFAQRALNSALRRGYNRLSDLEQIQCPALILAGEGDRHITPDSSYETAQHLPRCQWRLYRQVAHLFPWEIPQRVLQDIDAWIDQNPEVVSQD